jgi:hypothetical protein
MVCVIVANDTFLTTKHFENSFGAFPSALGDL